VVELLRRGEVVLVRTTTLSRTQAETAKWCT
jgi:hypothetical protein